MFLTGFLLKYNHVEFPNSRSMAEKRFHCLERCLVSNPDLYDNVKTQISQYQAQRDAHKASPEEAWFLSLNDVMNSKKKQQGVFSVRCGR